MINNIELDKQLQRRKVFLSDDENTIKEQKEVLLDNSVNFLTLLCAYNILFMLI